MKAIAEGVNEVVDEEGFQITYEAELGRSGKYFSLQIHTDRWMKPSDTARILILYAAMLAEHKTAQVFHDEGEDAG